MKMKWTVESDGRRTAKIGQFELNVMHHTQGNIKGWRAYVLDRAKRQCWETFRMRSIEPFRAQMCEINEAKSAAIALARQLAKE